PRCFPPASPSPVRWSARRRPPRPTPDPGRRCRRRRIARGSSATPAPELSPPGRRRSSLAILVRARLTARRSEPTAVTTRRRRREHNQHCLERGEVDGRPDDDRAVLPTAPAHRLYLTYDKALRVNAVDSRRHHHVPNLHIGRPRHVIHA